jgi:hypothetical protein
MPRSESVQFQHPYYETARQRQRREFDPAEIARELDKWAPMQARVASARIIETGWPL